MWNNCNIKHIFCTISVRLEESDKKEEGALHGTNDTITLTHDVNNSGNSYVLPLDSNNW